MADSGMADVWVCGDCRSINPLRSSRCYKCRAPRPPEGEEMAAATLPATPATPEPRPARPIGSPSRSPSGSTSPAGPAAVAETPSSRAAINPAARQSTVAAAVLGIVLLIVALGVRVLLTSLATGIGRRLVAADTIDDGELERLGWLMLVNPLISVVAIAGLGYWASRVVANVPLLGGGWPRFTPGLALLEHVIPGWNVLRVPAVYRDIEVRLSPQGRANDPLILLWVAATVAAVLVVRPVGSFVAGLASTTEDALGIETLVAYLSIGLQAVAILVVAVIVAEIESLQAARVRELEMAVTAAGARPAAGSGAAETSQAAAAFAARSITAAGGRRVELPGTAPRAEGATTPETEPDR